MKTVDEKNTNPGKVFMKFICKLLYVSGLGDCWYEPANRSQTSKFLYLIWVGICHFYTLSGIIGEVSSLFRSDLTVKERKDVILYSVAHPTVYLKLICLILQRERIKYFFSRMFKNNEHQFRSIDLEKAAIRRSMWYSFAIYFTVILCLIGASVDGIRTHYTTGIPMRTEVTFWPKNTDTGLIVNIFRIIIQLHFWYLLTLMSVTDAICLSSLIFMASRFKALATYFKTLNVRFNNLNEIEVAKKTDQDIKRDMIHGVEQHKDLLWCAQNLQDSLGNIYSIQVVQSIMLLGIAMLNFVTVEKSLTFLFANLSFILCMIALTVTYMTAAGDVTYEASHISTAIFQCGWEQYGVKAELRPLVTIALTRSQVPVVMTAFGIFNLSYATLITVIRSTYSFYAVMY